MHVRLDSNLGQQCVLVLSILQHLLSAERSFDVHALHACGTHIRSVGPLLCMPACIFTQWDTFVHLQHTPSADATVGSSLYPREYSLDPEGRGSQQLQ